MTDTPSAEDVLDEVYPERERSSLTTVQQGNHKQTVLAESPSHPSVVVQLSTRPDALRTEFALAEAIRERTSIPVPTVLAAGELDGVGYVVVERAPGVDLHESFTRLDSATRRRLVRRFGQSLAELHEAFPFEGYGAVTLDASTERPSEQSAGLLRATNAEDWQEWFTAYARDGLAALPPAFESVREPVDSVLTATDLPENPPSRLYPWDLRPGNALVDGGELTAVLDWGDPLAADPALSMAKAEYVVCDWYVDDGTRLRAALREGYESVRPRPSVPSAYRLVAAVHSAVDSNGVVTRPGFPERTGDEAIAFHTDRLTALLADHDRD